MKRATVAVARKLGVIMHRMWVTGGEFEFGHSQLEAVRRNQAERRIGDGCASSTKPDVGSGQVRCARCDLNIKRFGDHVLSAWTTTPRTPSWGGHCGLTPDRSRIRQGCLTRASADPGDVNVRETWGRPTF